jgi:hypothetical protein
LSDDVTAVMNQYREAARSLWNNLLRPAADFDRIDAFAAVCEQLFAESVLRPLGKQGFGKTSHEEPFPFLH